METLTIRSANIPGRVDNVAAAIQRAARGADVLFLNEGRHAHDEMRHVRGFTPEFCDDPALPMLHRTRLRVVGRHVERAYKDTYVGPWGAGPATLKAAWEHGICLDTALGDVWVVGFHAAPSVTRRAITKKARAARAKRRALHATEVETLVEMSQHMDQVVILGDGNAGPSYAGWKPLREAGFQLVSPGVTHGRNGRLDLAFVKGLGLVSSRTLPKNGSDHNPIEVVVRAI